MDIKNVLNSVLPINLRAKERVDQSIKAGTTTDRDANGQQAGKEKEQHEPMTEEQLKKAMELLKTFPAVKEHNLSVELVESGNKKFILLKEPNGKIIRRIPEEELWTLQGMKDSESKKGQLLRKTA